MRVLAEANGQAGWRAHAFPLSVDGVEIVASLVLLADRRTGRRSGWPPWTALAIGTAASLAANVATAGPAPISRIIAGWPAIALLIAVKLLSGMLEHRSKGNSRPDRPRPRPRPPNCHDHQSHADGRAHPSQVGAPHQDGDGPPTGAHIAALLPAARAAWDDLTRDGRPVTGDAIAKVNREGQGQLQRSRSRSW